MPVGCASTRRPRIASTFMALRLEARLPRTARCASARHSSLQVVDRPPGLAQPGGPRRVPPARVHSLMEVTVYSIQLHVRWDDGARRFQKIKITGRNVERSRVGGRRIERAELQMPCFPSLFPSPRKVHIQGHILNKLMK